MDITIKLWLLQIESLIADKHLEVALANRELSLGGWQSNHHAQCVEIDKQIDYIQGEIYKYK